MCEASHKEGVVQTQHKTDSGYITSPTFVFRDREKLVQINYISVGGLEGSAYFDKCTGLLGTWKYILQTSIIFL